MTAGKVRSRSKHRFCDQCEPVAWSVTSMTVTKYIKALLDKFCASDVPGCYHKLS
jgi:aspartokinase-like uncharacterized kinase